MSYTANNVQSLTGHSMDKPREWWERWLFLLPIMLWMSCIGQFMWPSYPDSFLLVAIWSLLSVAFLWFTVYSTGSIRQWRKSSDNWEAIYNSDGTTGVRKYYRPLNALLLAAANMCTLGCLIFLFNVLFQPNSSQISNTPAYTFIASCCITLFVFIWPSRVEAFNRRFAFRGSIVVLLVFAILLAFGAWVAVPRFLAGSPAPWPTLLAFAQHEAGKIDSTAYLDEVSASRNYYYFLAPSDPQYPSDVTFHFTGRAQRINVQVVDSDPPRLNGVRVEKGDPVAFDQATAYMQGLADRLAKVKIGPRDVYQQTEDEGQAFALKYGANPADLIVNVDLTLTLDTYKDVDVSTFWNIEYLVETQSVPDGLKSMDIRVDAATGKIVDRGEN